MDDNKALIDTSSLDETINQLATQAINESDVDKAKDLISLFNWNISKKNITRILKLHNLHDEVTDQMVRRFETRGDQFSNSDLLDYLKVLQGAIDTSSKNLSQIEEPPMIVQHNTNTQINVTMGDSFDRDSKERILAFVQATIAKAEKPNPVIIEDVEIKDVTENVEKEDTTNE